MLSVYSHTLKVVSFAVMIGPDTLVLDTFFSNWLALAPSYGALHFPNDPSHSRKCRALMRTPELNMAHFGRGPPLHNCCVPASVHTDSSPT